MKLLLSIIVGTLLLFSCEKEVEKTPKYSIEFKKGYGRYMTEYIQYDSDDESKVEFSYKNEYDSLGFYVKQTVLHTLLDEVIEDVYSYSYVFNENEIIRINHLSKDSTIYIYENSVLVSIEDVYKTLNIDYLNGNVQQIENSISGVETIEYNSNNQVTKILSSNSNYTFNYNNLGQLEEQVRFDTDISYKRMYDGFYNEDGFLDSVRLFDSPFGFPDSLVYVKTSVPVYYEDSIVVYEGGKKQCKYIFEELLIDKTMDVLNVNYLTSRIYTQYENLDFDL